MHSDLSKFVGDSRPFAYAFGVCAVAIALCAELLLSTLTGFPPSTTLFALSIALTAWYGGVGPGAFALALSAPAIDYVVVEPGTFLHFTSAGQLVLFLCYIAGWLGFCLLTERTYRSLRRDRDLRRVAEKAARQSDRLAELTSALGQARTPGAVIEAALQEPLHALDADAGVMVLTRNDSETAEVVRSVGHRQDGPQLPTVISLADKSPIRDAVGRGAPVIVESRNATTSEYRDSEELPGATQFRAAVAVPLLVGSRVVAVVQLEFSRTRTFNSEDRDYLFLLGSRAAQALDRTWQYEFVQRARNQAETLRARADEELEGRQQTEVALRASEARYRTLAARTNRLHGLTAALSEAVTALGHNYAVLDQSGGLRRIPPFVRVGDRYMPSLGVAAALRGLGIAPQEVVLEGRTLRLRDRLVPLLSAQIADPVVRGATKEQLTMLVNYRGPAVLPNGERPYTRYEVRHIINSELQLLNDEKPEIDPAAFKDKIVFVGLTASGLVDIFQSPFDSKNQGRMPGVQMHASVADSIISNRFIRPAGPAVATRDGDHVAVAALPM